MGNESYLGNKRIATHRGGLSVDSNDPYYLTHHRDQWELVETNGKYEFLPQFGKLVEMAGVNGVESVRGGIDSVMARAELQERGVTVLPMEMGYLTRFPTRSGGWYYTLKWNTPKEIAGRLLSKLDVDSWNNFRRELIATGVLDAIDPDLVEIMIHDLEREKDRLIPQQHIPERKLDMQAIDKKISDMQSALSKSTKKRKK
jgi:hypothetical protein